MKARKTLTVINPQEGGRPPRLLRSLRTFIDLIMADVEPCKEVRGVARVQCSDSSQGRRIVPTIEVFNSANGRTSALLSQGK